MNDGDLTPYSKYCIFLSEHELEHEEAIHADSKIV